MRARGVLPPGSGGDTFSGPLSLFGTAERNAVALLAAPLASTRSPWTLSRRPSPSTTKRAAKVARRIWVRFFPGHHLPRASRVPRCASSPRPEDPLTPSRLPRSQLAGSLIPDKLFTPTPGLWFTNQGYEVRRSTRARVRRVRSASRAFFRRDVHAPLRPSRDLDRPSRGGETSLTRKRRKTVISFAFSFRAARREAHRALRGGPVPLRRGDGGDGEAVRRPGLRKDRVVLREHAAEAPGDVPVRATREIHTSFPFSAE